MTSDDTSGPGAGWAPTTLTALTLLTEDLVRSRTFVGEVLGLPLVFADEQSAAFRLGATIVNLLGTEHAEPVITPVPAAPPGDGVRVLLTVEVDDVDAALAEVVGRGAEQVNGPVDRPWGVRTAVIRDPGGAHLWELAGPPTAAEPIRPS